MEIAKKYEPKEVEDRWYKFWLEKEYFKADADKPGKAFSLVIPPPNITGQLHVGHAFNNTLQDILSRWKRMQGYNVLWLPGIDHAGIATQNVIERQLKTEGLTRQQIGREKFVERVWQWKVKTGDNIINQLKRIGCSCDWSRQRFTMDEGFIKAVQTEFIQLYNEGYIYRGNYIINWCPRCHTALSDLEAEHKEIDGHLYYVKYELVNKSTSQQVDKLTDNSQLSTHNCIIVATTRPETIFGDVAIAVNPKDKRYKDMIGKKVKVPETCGGREIPVIADEYVDVAFGTGCLKITPAHDPADFQIGKKHNLEEIQVIGPDGKMNEFSGKYKGMDRFECRKAVVEDLKNSGLLEKTDDYKCSIGVCYRCGTYVEPYLSKQWFVKMKDLAEPAIKAVKDGKTTFVSETWKNLYFQWMENIHDWCISRQLWWGHRIPIWYCSNEDCKPIASIARPEKCACGSVNFVQDEDVLDTWFSSALWPFATMGWPDKTKDLRAFYPTSVLSTAFDIIFFWVARMMVMGIHFMKDVPFKNVYIHALIRDAEGQKMSKSKGNVIDPLGVIDRFGTDALRFTLSSLAVKGRDIYLSEERIEGYRNFMNKIWNASRFIFMNLEEGDKEISSKGIRENSNKLTNYPTNQLSLADRWIISRMNQVTKEVTEYLENFDFDKASLAIYEFFWHEFCDWYVEMAKLQITVHSQQSTVNSENKETAHRQTKTMDRGLWTMDVLCKVLEQSLRLMHPFIPFITEDIWQTLKTVNKSTSQQVNKLTHDAQHTTLNDSIMISQWPEYNKKETDKEAEEEMGIVKDLVAAIRNVRSELIMVPAAKITVMVNYKDKRSADNAKIIEANAGYVKFLAKIETLEIGKGLKAPKPSAVAVARGMDIYIPLAGIIDIDKEKERLEKAIGKARAGLEQVSRKLSDDKFVKNAPKEIVEKEQERKKELEAELKKLEDSLKRLAD